MTTRSDFLASLAAAGFTPNRAILFEEGSGTPNEYYSGSPVGLIGSPSWLVLPGANAGYCPTVNDGWDLGNSSLFLGTTAQTILIVRKKLDTTLRSAQICGVNVLPASTATATGYAPWSDGKAYWDFGSANVQQISYAGYVTTTALEALGFRAGAAGLSIWLNGTKLVNGPVYSRTSSTATFRINTGLNGSQGGDLQYIYFVALIPSQVSDAVMATFTPLNVLGPTIYRLGDDVGKVIGLRSKVSQAPRPKMQIALPAGSTPTTGQIYPMSQALFAAAQEAGVQQIAMDIPYPDLVFSGTGAMTWTVDSADLAYCRLVLMGNLAILYFRFATTSIGGTPDTSLQFDLPAYVPASNANYVVQAIGLVNCGSPTQPMNEFARLSIGANSRRIVLTRSGSVAWPAASNNLSMQGEAMWLL